MIKFVCASCGERLSVPDQHGGRKGMCPVCQSVNRIPLKGFAETQPSAPTVARTAPASAQTPMQAERGTPQPAPPPARIGEPSIARRVPTVGSEIVAPIAPPTPVFESAPPAPASPVEKFTPPAPAASTERFTSATKFIPPPDDAANLRSIRRAKQAAAKNTPDYDSPTQSVREWHLPKNVKIALLIIAALGIVAALYFGLLMALRAAVPGA